MLILSLGFVLIFGIVIWRFIRSEQRLGWAPVVWCSLLVSLLNVLSPTYYLVTGDDTVFKGVAPERIVVGLGMNLMYLVFWIFGYLVIWDLARRGTRSVNVRRLSAEVLVLSLFLGFSLAVKLWITRQGFNYGYGQYLYAYRMDEAGAFGVWQVFAKLVGPVAAALLCARTLRDSVGVYAG